MDELKHLAEVRVAGSNPVFRSIAAGGTLFFNPAMVSVTPEACNREHKTNVLTSASVPQRERKRVLGAAWIDDHPPVVVRAQI